MPERAIEHTIDLTKSDQMKVSIRLSADGFSFAIYQPGQKQPCYFTVLDPQKSTSQLATFRQLLTENEILDRDYRHVHIITDTPRYTTLPSGYYRDSGKESVLYYNHSRKENEIILSTELPEEGIVVIYGMNRLLHQLLNDKYKHITFHSQADILIHQLNTIGQEDNNQRMFANIHPSRIDFYCYEDRKLILVNSIDCKENADRIYYLLNIWKKIGFDQTESKLYMMGDIIERDELVADLKRFITHISILNTRQPDHIEGTIPFDMQLLTQGKF